MSFIGTLGLGLVFWGVVESPTFNGIDFAGWVLLWFGFIGALIRYVYYEQRIRKLEESLKDVVVCQESLREEIARSIDERRQIDQRPDEKRNV